jgi:nucleoside-diphosphate-sugar epimerase
MAQDDVVVILGGAGFIGQALAARLRGNVRELRIVSRKVASQNEPGVRYMSGDVLDAARMLEVIEGATVVYQLTVEGRWTDGARNVADACVRHRVRRLVFASTSDALNLSRRGTIYETEGPDPRPQARNSYSQGKVASELLLREYAQRDKLAVVIVRPCLVVGRGGRLAHGGIGRWPTQTTLVAWGDGNNKMPFVLVQDVAQAMALALDAPGIDGKAFNLAGDVFLSAREYAAIAADRTFRNIRCFPRNLFTFSATNLVKAKLKGLLTRKKVDYQTYYDVASSSMRTFVDNSQSKKLLGWKPNDSLDTFIHEAIDPYVDPLHPDDFRLSRW